MRPVSAGKTLALPDDPRVLAIFTEAASVPKGAVIVVHGLGVHPDWNLIGDLRTRLAERGYATLAVQMPVLAADGAMPIAICSTPRMPVLDVVAERDFPEALAAAKSRALALPRDACSKGVSIAGTDHYMDGATTPLAEVIRGFLDRVFAGACGISAPR